MEPPNEEYVVRGSPISYVARTVLPTPGTCVSALAKASLRGGREALGVGLALTLRLAVALGLGLGLGLALIVAMDTLTLPLAPPHPSTCSQYGWHGTATKVTHE
jgi:hypothetical protein